MIYIVGLFGRQQFSIEARVRARVTLIVEPLLVNRKKLSIMRDDSFDHRLAMN
jgi:hypothetical protein